MNNVIVSYDPRHGWGPFNGPLVKGEANPPVWFGVGKVVKNRVAEEVRMPMWSVDFMLTRWIRGEFEPYVPGNPRGPWDIYEELENGT
jgi:hypothetical protein